MGVQHLAQCCKYLSSAIYGHIALPDSPIHNGTTAKKDRNLRIIKRYNAGETLSELAADFGISEQRVHQIINGRRK